jgi:pimeloyl-ACP methyl ester carboxylesterase
VLVLACDPPNVVEHYDYVIALLAPTHRLVVVEMPGFGFSRPLQGFGFTIGEYELAVERLLEELEVSDTALMFPCVWGYVAVQLAARRPDRVRGLILAQAPSWSEEVAWARRIDSNGLIRTPFIGQAVMAAAPGAVARRWYRAALPAGLPVDEFVQPALAALRAGGLFCLASFTQAWFGRATPTLSPVDQPAVLMWGQSDRSHRRSRPESALPYVRHGQIVAYADSGHFPELERPDHLHDALARLDTA